MDEHIGRFNVPQLDLSCSACHSIEPGAQLVLVDVASPRSAMEVIWGNRLKSGDYKYIGGFPHFVADAGEERTGRWLDEKIDLARVYGEIWKDAAPAHLINVAVFCDSDDTHTASISYFAYVRLERRVRLGKLVAANASRRARS
jgi:hypothetical protein